MFCTTSHAFNVGSSTSVFLLWRIRKVSFLFFSLNIFLAPRVGSPFLFIFFFFFFLGGGGGGGLGAPRVVLDIPMGWGFKVGI